MLKLFNTVYLRNINLYNLKHTTDKNANLLNYLSHALHTSKNRQVTPLEITGKYQAEPDYFYQRCTGTRPTTCKHTLEFWIVYVQTVLFVEQNRQVKPQCVGRFIDDVLFTLISRAY